MSARMKRGGDSMIERRSMERIGLQSAMVWLAIFCSVTPLGACRGRRERVTVSPGASFEERLDAAFQELERRAVPVLVAVSHQGGASEIREFGKLRGDGIAPEQTQVDLNSITKTVTAVMTLKLVEQGRLKVDETLGELFSDVPPDKRAITVHQLLTHAAGFVEALGDDDEPLDKAAFLKRAFASKLRSKPGATYHYANTGFGLLAAIIEQRAGKSYEQFLHDDVLAGLAVEPLGYESVYDAERSLRTARGRTLAEASWGGVRPFWNLIGNGGLIATAPSFLRFRRALSAGELLSPELFTAMHTPHIAEDDEGSSFYGYGLVVQDVEGIGRVYWHDGGNDVYSAHWADYVDRGDLIFTAGADSSRGDAFEAMELIATYLYGDTGAEED